jgi:ArsR family transcriptional regulator
MKRTRVVLDIQKLHYSAELARALAHPLRLKILEFLDQHPDVQVNKIYRTLNIEQSITSQHLRVLRAAGVVNFVKEGKYAKYYINYEVVKRAELAVKRFLGK